MQEIIKSIEFLKAIDMSVTPIVLLDENYTLKYVNKAFIADIGYEIEQIPTKEAWLKKAYPDPNYREEVLCNWDKSSQLTKRKSRFPIHMTSKICCADDTFKWFDVYEETIGSIKVMTFLNIDESHRSYQRLMEVVEQKDILLSVMAHDVRSPLSNIRQIVEHFRNMDMSQQDRDEIFSGLGSQIDYVFNIINGVLVRANDERGRFVKKREYVFLKTFFCTYREYYKKRMEKLNIEFVLELEDEVTVHFDSFILDVICRNLIDNAIKYSSRNGKIYVSFSKATDGSRLVIRDTGSGMSADQIERILNKKGSRRLKNQITDSFGIGLILANEILEKQSGKLLIESELGKGTSFIVFFSNEIAA